LRIPGITKPAGNQPGHSVFVTLIGEFIGVMLLAIFADSGEGPGKIAVAIMGAWFLVFLMVNAQTLSEWVRVFNG